jgi:hypothetical protein
MARTHTFKGSNFDFGYYAFIENNMLVIGEARGSEGGIIYTGGYGSCPAGVLNTLHKENTRLYNSIVQYYDKTTNYQFADSRDLHGNGWCGWIEDGKLVIGHEAPREGGILFRGTYTEAADRGWLATLLREDQRLYNDIERYFIKHGVKDESDKRATHSTGDERCAAVGCCSEGDPRQRVVGYFTDPNKKTNEDFKKYGFDVETKTILFKVKLHKKNGVVHNVLVRGRFQADVIKKLMPQIPEVLTLQTPSADVFAIRSDEISAVEFVESFSAGVTITKAVGIK